ncbi:exopolyphosphatase [Moelleriella libera RCEF 2490]|uniref:Exopolyphosphatase n=1 Tax=Moelleriella libera RCEF 2490 TaxID=1081109 RepID=A0A168BFX9_9HYPO|nr:exopolyphosphatase [Moelleriella libera RCEF 2490]
MASPLQTFLATARNALKGAFSSSSSSSSSRAPTLTFVVGNESADLDSLCSAVVYAFVRTHQAQAAQQQQQQHAPPPPSLHIPLSNLSRDDLALRTEMTYVLRQAAGLRPSDLITLSDLPDHVLHGGGGRPESTTRWVLVDHNALTGPLARFSDQVVGCVDHHVDEGAVPAKASPRTIEPCGSCMSLIVAETRQQQQDAAAGGAWHDAELAKLALAPILVDTTNLTSASKVRPKDTAAVSFLLGQLPPAFDATAYYDAITKVKEDLSGLSLRDIFRKDYKQWDQKLGVCCAVQNLEYVVSRAGDNGAVAAFLEALAAWAREKDLDVVAVMTTSHAGGQFHRDLLVWGRSARGRDAVRAFERLAGETLQLRQWKDGVLDDDADTRRAWNQLDLASSRKQVAPLLREALRGV